MTLFHKIAEQHIKCEICGKDTIALYGCGWENDIIYCEDDACGAEYIFPTSTSVDDEFISKGE